MSFWWSLALLALSLGAAVASPETRLLAAWREGDFDEAERVAAEVGARGVTPALESGRRELSLAGVIAAPAAPDDWRLLLPLAGLADGPDRPVAAGAARAAARIAATIERGRVLNEDIPVDLLRAQLAAWRRLGAAADRWPDVRVHALEVGSHLAPALGDEATDDDVAYALPARLADPEPEVRRAAAELAPQPLPVHALVPLGERVRTDPDPVVAVASAQALCAGLAWGDDADSLLDALGDEGLARIRELVADRSLPAVAQLDAARCLVAADADDNRAAARAWTRTAPAPLGRELREALGR